MSAKHKATGKNYRSRAEQVTGESTQKDDYFPTYHALTRKLLEVEKFSNDDIFLEPCAGAGDITKIIKEFYPYAEIIECDINPRRQGIIKANFLKEYNNIVGNKKPTVIITNPPFKLSIEFFVQCAKTTANKIYFIWPLDYIHGVDRQQVVYSNKKQEFRLKKVYTFIRRPFFGEQFHPAGPIETGATTFSWFYFERGYSGEPIIKWINTKEQMGRPWESSQITMFDSAPKEDIIEWDLIRSKPN